MNLIRLFILSIVTHAFGQENSTNTLLTAGSSETSNGIESEEKDDANILDYELSYGSNVDGTSGLSNDAKNESSPDKTQEKRGIYGAGFGFGHGTGYYGPSVYSPQPSYGFAHPHPLGPTIGHGINTPGTPGGVYGQLPPKTVPFYGFGYGYKPGQPISHGVVKAVTIHKEIPVAVPQPYPVTVEKKVPVPVKVPVAYPVDRPYPVHIPKPYPVPVDKPVPYPVEKPVPYPVKIPVKVPVSHPVPYPVPKPYPVPVSKPVPVPYPQPVYIKKVVPVYQKPHFDPHAFGQGYYVKSDNPSFINSGGGFGNDGGFSSVGGFGHDGFGGVPGPYPQGGYGGYPHFGVYGHDTLGSYAQNPETVSNFSNGPVTLGSSAVGPGAAYGAENLSPENYESSNH